MTDPIRTAAQALVDAWGTNRAMREAAFDALRRALASPAPSTSRDDARDAALEEAAQVAEENDDSMMIGIGIAERIRSLKGHPSPTPDPSTKEQP